MTNQTKQGFSLVEVMILFTVLAVTMAATLPVITKKSKPVPTKVAHGVYRCIANADGETYTEETYNSFRLLNRNPEAESCNFSVPKSANIYKIDLYSAGAGGTKYAAYSAAQDDNRDGHFRMQDAVTYAKSDGSKLPFVMDSGLQSNRKDMPYTLDNDDILWAFGGLSSTGVRKPEDAQKVIITAYSANAGDGGDSSFSYHSPMNSVCTAISSGQTIYDQNVVDASKELNDAQKAFNALYKTYTDKEEALEKKAQNYQKYYNANDAILTSISGYEPTLSNYIDKMTTLNQNLSEFKSASGTSAQRVYLYDNHIKNAVNHTLADEGVDAVNTFLRSVSYDTVDGEGKGSYSATYNYDNITNRLANMKTKIGNVDTWVNTISTIHEDYDSDGNLVTRPKTPEELAQDHINKIEELFGLLQASTSSIKSDFNNYQIYARLMTAPGVTSIVTMQNSLKTVKSNINTANTNLSSKLSVINGPVTQEGSLLYQIQERLDAEKEGGELHQARKAVSDAQEKYNTAVAHKTQFEEDKKSKARPSQYNTGADLMFDTKGYTKQQMEDYCKAVYKDYYDAMKNSDGSDGVAVFQEQSAPQTVSQKGGLKGTGIYLRLEYPLYYTVGEEAIYKAKDENVNFQKYPYAKYIGDLYGNIKKKTAQGTELPGGKGYSVATCKIKTGDLSTANCTSGATPSNAGSGEHISSSDADDDHFQIEDKTHVLKYTELDENGNMKGAGKDVEKYLAFHIPNFETHDSAGKYVVPYTTNATGGKMGAVGYIETDSVYSLGDLDTNLAWSVFKGEGETANQTYSTHGQSATKDGEPEATRFKITKVDGNYFQEPKLTMTAQLWSKHYYLGHAGGRGNKVHVQTTTMGSRCQITIPFAGPTFDYFALGAEAKTKGKNPDRYRADKKLEYESKLNAQIECRDDDNNLVLLKTATGGKYNINVTDQIASNIFYWRKSDGENAYVHTANDSSTAYKANYDGVGSRWAKIFYSIVGGNRTIKPLSEFGVSNGGSHSKLDDRCTASKGGMRLRVFVLGSNLSQSYIEYGTSTKVKDTDKGMSYNGQMDGVDCYQDDSGSGHYNGIFTINPHDNNKSSIVHESTNAEEDKNYKYVLYPPTPAGGGAIVITW